MKYVIKDKFRPALYFIRGLEWTYDIDKARKFASHTHAVRVNERLPYKGGVVEPVK